MKLNTGKCHLLISGNKNAWVKLDQDMVWRSNDVKLLAVKIDNNLRFDKHVSNICLKANRKLNALTRVSKFVSCKKRHILFKAFIESQFKYCPLVWNTDNGRGQERVVVPTIFCKDVIVKFFFNLAT